MTMAAPFVCPERQVESAWIDYNNHMNMAFYSLVFDQGLDCMYETLGIGVNFVEQTSCSTFTLEAHVTYVREVVLGDPLRITFQLLDWDAKRIHLIGQMYHAEQGYLAATSEQLSMCINLETRRSTSFPEDIQTRLKAMMTAHAALPQPPQVGRVIGIRRRPS